MDGWMDGGMVANGCMSVASWIDNWSLWTVDGDRSMVDDGGLKIIDG